MGDYIVTLKMRLAGEQFASDAMDAQICKAMGGLGGSKTFLEWDKKDYKNKDLLLKYINYEIDSVTGIYLAMDRERIGRQVPEDDPSKMIDTLKLQILKSRENNEKHLIVLDSISYGWKP